MRDWLLKKGVISETCGSSSSLPMLPQGNLGPSWHRSIALDELQFPGCFQNFRESVRGTREEKGNFDEITPEIFMKSWEKERNNWLVAAKRS